MSSNLSHEPRDRARLYNIIVTRQSEWDKQVDAEFTDAVRRAHSWAEVFRLLGRRSTGNGYDLFKRRAEDVDLKL